MSTKHSQSGQHNLLFFSLERWDEVWRRNQFICSSLLQRNNNLRILWVNPPIDALGRSDGLHRLRSAPEKIPDSDRLWMLDLLKPLPNILGRWINESCFLKKIESALHNLDFVDPMVWINDQNMAPIVKALNLVPLVYDVTDDWISSSLTSRQRATVVRNDSWLVEHSKHVVVCSERLRKLKNAAKTLHLIPNGVDYFRYHPEQLAKYEKPKDLADINGPIVGYTGTLHEDRLDTKLLRDLATMLSAVNFVFVGPNCLGEEANAELARLNNVQILGLRPYSQLPSYVSTFDICFVPHKVNAFTDSLDPLKLYEYFATGKPIVSTPCAGFRDFPELVHLCANASSMAADISAILSSGEANEMSKSRLSYAANNDWQIRIKQIEPILGIEACERLTME